MTRSKTLGGLGALALALCIPAAIGTAGPAQASPTPATLAVFPGPYTVWSSAAPVAFQVVAYDDQDLVIGDVTQQASLTISPDGSCTQGVCTPATAGSHTVTATLGSLTASVTLYAGHPGAALLPTLPTGQAGTHYSTSVLQYPDDPTLTELGDTATPLPPGLKLTRNGVLEGTPTVAGTYTFYVFYRNAAVEGNLPTTITIAPAPAVLPTLSASRARVVEGDTGQTTVSVPITLSEPSAIPLTVNWRTADKTAVAGTDYVAARGTVTIPAGQTTASVPVTVLGDTTPERNETFQVVLAKVHGVTLGSQRAIVTIANDD